MASLLPLFGSGGASRGGQASFDARFVNCVGQPQATTLVVRDLKSRAIVTHEPATKHDAITSDFHGTLQQGLYSFYVHAGRCYGGGLVGLLSGRTRDVAIGGGLEPTPEPLPSGLHRLGTISDPGWSGAYALAGRLPLDGLSVTIHDSCGKTSSVFIDGSAYYDDSLAPGDYLVEVRGTSGGTIVKVRVALKNALTVRDISLREVDSGKWVDLPPNPNC